MAAAAAPALLRRLGSSGGAAASRRRSAGPAVAAAAARPWRWQQPHAHRSKLQAHGSGAALCTAPSRLVAAAAAAAADASTPTAEAAPAADQPHVSVLLREVLAAFEGLAVRRYVDGTLGAAGHASAMLAQHPELHTLVGFDLDPTAHALASTRLAAAGTTVVPVAVSRSGAISLDTAAAAASGGRTALIVRSNFGRMRTVLQQLPLGGGGDGSPASSSSSSSSSAVGVDAILLDLGISSMQVRRTAALHPLEQGAVLSNRLAGAFGRTGPGWDSMLCGSSICRR